MANWRIGPEGRTPNADYSRFNGGGDYNPNAGIIAPTHGGMYDPHGSDRFRFSPQARHSFREGRGRDQVDYWHNVGSPGNWGWQNRHHLGNDHNYGNHQHNSYGWHAPHPRPAMDRGFSGGGQRGHQNHGNGANYAGGGPYGGRRYPITGSRNVNSTSTTINQRGNGNSAAVSNGGGSATASSNVTGPTYVRHYW